MTGSEVLYATPVGSAHLTLDVPEVPVALLVLSHGAGGDIDAPDLTTVRDAALALGIAVLRLRQPYRQAGRRAPAPAAQLDVAYAAVLAGVGDGSITGTAALVGLPWVVGGRSSGARVAARVAAAAPGLVAGVLALAFPLSPPGRPGVSRLDELVSAGVPTLVVQGSRDGFGSAAVVRAAVGDSGVAVAEIVDADHSFRTRRSDATTTAQALAAVAGAAGPWLADRAAAPRSRPKKVR
ncbi:alpha/beta hydrolase [Acidothermaceae bacterium B102]|nr:alpha/beta hydrolase [Acidothermaceae bacterium B102]